MRAWTDWAALIAATFIVLIFAGAISIGIAWMWQNAQDKRACRTHGGTVVDVGDHAEWHCVGSTPEARP